MGTAQLQGKRTGRPPGIKSRPWRRAVLWCIRNLDKADAVPPSPLAGRLLALGREHPDRLVEPGDPARRPGGRPDGKRLSQASGAGGSDPGAVREGDT